MRGRTINSEQAVWIENLQNIIIISATIGWTVFKLHPYWFDSEIVLSAYGVSLPFSLVVWCITEWSMWTVDGSSISRRQIKKEEIRLSMVVTRCHCESGNQSEYQQRGNSLHSVRIWSWEKNGRPIELNCDGIFVSVVLFSELFAFRF